MKRLALLLLLMGCDTNVAVDPEGHRCDFAAPCPAGFTCVDGACRRGTPVDPSCDGVTCDAPPASTCTSSAVLRTYDGRCVAGACRYEPLDMTCATSCAGGACVDACQGVSCVTPPSPACVDADTLRTFAMAGTCGNGTCTYAPTDTPCPHGCENAVCKGVDLCETMNVTCTTAPEPVCLGATRRAFTAPGTCDPGTGQCSYAQVDTPCPNGCALGNCLMASATFSQTGPRVRFAINGLDVAPGSSGNSALAVGNGGRLARWDGTGWTELTTPSNSNLNAVSFVTGTLAWVVGNGATAYTVRATTGVVTPQTLLSASTTHFRFVSGRGEGEVLVTDAAGGWWRYRANAWTSGTLPQANAPWVVRGAYLDESLRERVVGSCAAGATRRRCVALRSLGGSPTSFTTHDEAGATFTAVGGGFPVPSSFSSEALLGLGDNLLRTHGSSGLFGNEATSPALSGLGVVGITAQAGSTSRDVYVLTSSAAPTGSTVGEGHLFRLVRGITGVTANDALTTYFGEEALSANDANGVLVAEVRRADGVNNVFRRGPITNEALDVGEDLVGASLDPAGALVLASVYGDVMRRAVGSSTWDFRRPPAEWAIRGLEARNGAGVLLVGRRADVADGLVIRNTGGTFVTVATAPGTPLNAVCRVSDMEGWAVGAGGVIFRVTAAGATSVPSPTTKELLAVDCSAGNAMAVGVDGTVLRLTNGAWAEVTPAFPVTTERLTTVQLIPGGAYVGSDGVFARLGQGGWVTLPSQAGLARLVARSSQEVYGAFVTNGSTAIHRFDGAAWGPGLITVSASLRGGVQAGSRVVWGGTLGAIVEGG